MSEKPREGGARRRAKSLAGARGRDLRLARDPPNLSVRNQGPVFELGNGDNFVFDLGIGSLRNYNFMRVTSPYNTIDHVFLTHLHMDHVSDLLYLMMFRGFNGGWTPLNIYGPSGSEPRDGTAHFVEHMMEMSQWHQDSFNGFPIGDGYEPAVHEFDFMNAGEVIYDNNGVQVTHWPTSHTQDSASSYRLDWNGRSLCYTRDGTEAPIDRKRAREILRCRVVPG